MSIHDSELTPLMRQYHTLKEQHPDAVLLFQVGDFYELFFEDAKKAAAILGIALTKRGKVNGEPIPLCGVPVHSLNHYLPKLVKAGLRVALCQQLEEAKPGKVVQRGITQVLTPGTLTDTTLLNEKSASYLLSFFPDDKNWGLLFAEILTAQLFATVIPVQALKSLEEELGRFFPDEIIVPEAHFSFMEPYFKKLGYGATSVMGHSNEDKADPFAYFDRHIQQTVFSQDALKKAFLNFYHYLQRTQLKAIAQFTTIHCYDPNSFLLLDHATQSNLELVCNGSTGATKNTLFELLDGAVTSMGSRTIKKWIMRPLVNQTAIEERQQVVQTLLNNVILLQQLEQKMQEVSDIERVIGRIALGRASIRDYIHLKQVLHRLPEIYLLLKTISYLPIVSHLSVPLSFFDTLSQLLHKALNDNDVKDWIIKENFDDQLDSMRDLVQNASKKIIELEIKEQKSTGINSLKIRYNQVFGYYLEVTKTHTTAIPERYIRQQTLVGRERYITHELQVLQHEITNAQVQSGVREKQLFDQLKNEVMQHINPLRKLAHSLANLDAFIGFAKVAYQYRYSKPIFNNNQEIKIDDGRHPMVERVLGNAFIPNSTVLNATQSTLLITGPNMGGKSTYLRQVALIQIMAQIGSFVPAKNADLFVVDRIFTRIGAGDNLSQGKSTFLVEMEEAATICLQATQRSLVILDEVGRGTSTFDGMAIAQAVLEYITTVLKAPCLFATHYHELTSLPHRYATIANFYAASRKTTKGIQFLYKIVPGVAEASFGIEVAKLAQLPEQIILRAQEILEEMAPISSHNNGIMPQVEQLQQKLEYLQKRMQQLQAQQELLENIDYNNLSPKAAFDLVWKIKELR